MKRLLFLIVLVGCEPHFESGKTQCSDSEQCPSGFVCGNNGFSSAHVCFDQKVVGCSEHQFYCEPLRTCVLGPGACGTGGGAGQVGGLGGSSGTGVTSGGAPGTSRPVNGSSCTSPSYPMYCDAVADVEAGCWASGTVCSTITSCNGVPKACGSSTKKVFCGGPDCCTPPPAGGSCSLPACGCPSGEVCYPDTSATGMLCVATDGIGLGQACSGLVCAAGLGCFAGTCKPYCLTDTDCPLVDSARACLSTSWSASGDPIPGVSVCARVCDPVSPQAPRTGLLACPSGFGCDSDTAYPGASNCLRQSGKGIAGSACSTMADCSPGHYCTTANICMQFCFSDADCPGSTTCNAFTEPNYAGTHQVGYCY
jgi:hypothetical protein